MDEQALISKKKDEAVSFFLDITKAEHIETAINYLKKNNWNLESALHMFYGRQRQQLLVSKDSKHEVNTSVEEPKDSKNKVWESDTSGAPTSDGSKRSLALLYRQPLSLMYKGSFEKAREEAQFQNKWLIVNLQSDTEFSSHLLNRDTWSEETVEETIQANFIFWQVYDDNDQSLKVRNYYNVAKFPAILIIDPITGQKIRAWTGMIEPQDLLEVLLSYIERGPKECLHSNSRKHSIQKAETSSNAETDKIPEDASKDTKPIYLLLPEEPEGPKELLCKVAVRFPDGRRIQRSFLLTESVKLLWSFCSSQMETKEATRPFLFTRRFPPTGSSKSLDVGSNATFEEEKISNTLLSLEWL